MSDVLGLGGGANGGLFCCFHPREFLVGVCAHCLRDRLLLLLATASSSSKHGHRALRRRAGISLPRVFALLHRQLDYNDDGDDDDKNNAGAGADEDASAASLDDSFISIKFEDNGKATWDSSQKAAAGAGDDDAAKPRAATAVVEHVKRGGRWRKLLQLARWKRYSKHQQEQRSKGRSWIRSLTRRRADRACS